MFSDDDEEIVEYLSRIVSTRQVCERTNLFQSLSDDKFVRRFRLTKETFLILLQEIEPLLKSNTTCR